MVMCVDAGPSMACVDEALTQACVVVVSVLR